MYETSSGRSSCGASPTSGMFLAEAVEEENESSDDSDGNDDDCDRPAL